MSEKWVVLSGRVLSASKHGRHHPPLNMGGTIRPIRLVKREK